MRKYLVAAMATMIALVGVVAVVAPSNAEARSYTAKSVNKANKWAVHRYRSALYVESNCVPAGYRRAECRIDVTKSASACSVLVTVRGPSYRVRPFDSTC